MDVSGNTNFYSMPGVFNQIFPQERHETQGCLFNSTPEDTLTVALMRRG